MNPESQSKGALRSKAVWGAILTLVGAFGLLPFGITFDAQTGDVTINLYNVVAAIGAAAVPGGAVLSWLGRLGAKSVIRGLW